MSWVRILAGLAVPQTATRMAHFSIIWHPPPHHGQWSFLRWLKRQTTTTTSPYLLDNAYDPDVNARELYIDKQVINSEVCLTFQDNGAGLNWDKLHKMLRYVYLVPNTCVFVFAKLFFFRFLFCWCLFKATVVVCTFYFNLYCQKLPFTHL